MLVFLSQFWGWYKCHNFHIVITNQFRECPLQMRNFFKDIMLDTKGFFSLSKTLTSALFDVNSFTRWAVCKVMAFLIWLLPARAKIYILFIVLFKCGFPFTRITLSYHASAYVGISFNYFLSACIRPGQDYRRTQFTGVVGEVQNTAFNWSFFITNLY